MSFSGIFTKADGSSVPGDDIWDNKDKMAAIKEFNELKGAKEEIMTEIAHGENLKADSTLFKEPAH